jgi:protease IV
VSLESDLLVDRRRLKRRLFVWRTLAIVAVVVAAVVAIGPAGKALGGKHVARLTVTGLITDDRKRVEAVEALARDKNVAALLLVVDSPGGSVAGGESLHDAIAKVAAVKPVIAVMGGTAASAAYMISAPATRIFARAGTLTGSIGVILQAPEFSGLMRTLGIDDQTIVSGPLKGQPSLSEPLSDQGRAYLHDLVMALFDQFVTIVADGRHLTRDQVLALADGRAYTGQQALKLGLVDQIGGESDARAWLASDKHVSTDLPVEDVTIGSLSTRMLSGALDGLLGDVLKSVGWQGVKLDGAWAVWQPFGH